LIPVQVPDPKAKGNMGCPAASMVWKIPVF
jgi:hypothetical protein